VWKVPGAAVNQDWINGGKYDQPVPYTYFKDLAHGTELELHFKAALTSNQVEADAIVAPLRSYRVKAVEDVKPVIGSVIDSKGVAIPQNGLTVDSSVKVSGTATPNLDILIYNNGVSTGGRATADAQGKWERDLVGLAQGDCNLTAVAQYGSNPVSVIWKIIVTPMVTPTITSIKDSKGDEIPHGGITVDTRVILTGTASKGQKVDVREGTDSRGQPPADATTGIWTLDVSGLGLGASSFTARGKYGGESESAAWSFKVLKAVSGSENWELVPLGIIPYNLPRKLPSGLTYTFSEININALNPRIADDPLPDVKRYLATGSPVMSRYDLGGVAKNIKIIYRTSNTFENQVVFYDDSGAKIHSEYLQQNTWLNPKTIDFKTDKNCTHFTLSIFNTPPVAGIGVTDIIWS
jgi:hypothetical protein